MMILPSQVAVNKTSPDGGLLSADGAMGRVGLEPTTLCLKASSHLHYRADFVHSLASCARVYPVMHEGIPLWGRRPGRKGAGDLVAQGKINHRSPSSLSFHGTERKNKRRGHARFDRPRGCKHFRGV